MNDSSKQMATDCSQKDAEKILISEKTKDIEKEKKDKIADDDVELRKHSRPYRALLRNRKLALPINESQTNTEHQPSTSNGRSKSLSWYRTTSIRQPQFSSNLFSKRSSRQNRKLSAPVFLSVGRERPKR